MNRKPVVLVFAALLALSAHKSERGKGNGKAMADARARQATHFPAAHLTP